MKKEWRKTMRKKIISTLLCVTMVSLIFAGCGAKNNKKTKETASGKVYFLNFKPEIADAYVELMKEYTKETNVEAKVLTVADNQYESTLKVEMAKSDAPTIFTINGYVGYDVWKDRCENLKDTKFYSLLSDKKMAIVDGDGVYAIPLMQESYGIICNKKIFNAYFGLEERDDDTGCNAIEDINSFEKLKAVTEDMQDHKEELGIDGAFSEIALNSTNNWRITNHLFCMPLYYEYNDAGVEDKEEIQFSYADKYKNMLDLYLDNSVLPREEAESGTVEGSMAEFTTGKSAMVQNGTWSWGEQISVEGSVISPDDLYYMPIYIGANGEEKQGLCTGTENYIAINSKASKEDIKASEDFLEWLYTSDKGKEFVSTHFGVAPFEGFDNQKASESNPLVKLALEDSKNPDTVTVDWVFNTIPSQNWKDALGTDLLSYALGKTDWNTVVNNAKQNWISEKMQAEQ